MNKSIRRSLFLALIATFTFTVTHCSASIIEDVSLSLVQGSGNGFSFSWLHSATGSGTGKSATGTTVALGGAVNNSIVGDYDTVSEIFTVDNQSSALNHADLTLSNGNKILDTTLRFSGGKLIFDGDWNGGFLDYVASVDASANGGGSNETITGSFYFAAKQETGNGSSPFGQTPNSGVFSGTSIDFAEWGNNWTYTGGGADWSFLATVLGKNVSTNGIDTADASTNRMGIDLHGTGEAIPTGGGSGGIIPEPVSIAVWGSLLLFSTVTCGRRRI